MSSSFSFQDKENPQMHHKNIWTFFHLMQLELSWIYSTNISTSVKILRVFFLVSFTATKTTKMI